MRSIPATATACLAIAFLATGCERRHVRWYEPPPGFAQVPVDSATAARNATREPGVLGTVETIPVVGWLGPDGNPFEVARRSAAREGGHARVFGTITLPVSLRSGAADLSQYPCTACHQGRKLVMEDQRIKDAHQNLQVTHPKQTGAHCSTCHSADDVQQLALRSGEHATLDESYRLCAQCHFEKVEAWANGAHGKRLDGWQGRRVVMACPDCHDPHAPGLQPRVPFRAPQLERTKGLHP